MRRPNQKVLITCEHGGNEIPEPYAPLFAGAEKVLATHRGYDLGALEIFQELEDTVADFSMSSQTSRLLVELNRSLHHPRLFSEFTKSLPPEIKEKIILDHYSPFRNEVENKVRNWTDAGHFVLHLSVHSFTPELNGKIRNADIGLLYDPARETEQLFAAQWRQQFQKMASFYKVRYNYPYKGTADGFVSYLRKHFSNAQYAGLELEVNQKFKEQDSPEWAQVKALLVHSFQEAL